MHIMPTDGLTLDGMPPPRRQRLDPLTGRQQGFLEEWEKVGLPGLPFGKEPEEQDQRGKDGEPLA
jgi:hypothetical protein